MSGDYLDRLAALVCAVRFGDLRDGAISASRAVTLDTIGAILAGSRLAENARLGALAAERSGHRTATVIGQAGRAEPMLAALANGTAGVSLEMDEGNRWGGGHPAIHVLPAALAVAEETGAGGQRLIEGLIAGYEVTSRLGGATTQRDNVHSHGTWGTIGAAVAVARVLGLGAAEVRAAINLAASMSPANTWTPCMEGATIRNVYAGRAGLNGILAVHLLRCGYTALRDGPSDVYGTILADRFDAPSTLDGLGAGPVPDVFRIERNYFKFHACCYYNHSTLDAVLAITRQEQVRPEAIERIDVTSFPFPAARMIDPAPSTMLAAKFSVPYAVAAAIVLGRTDVAAFSDPPREEGRIQNLARHVHLEGNPALSLRSADVTAQVAITLRDGRVLSAETTIARGDALNPVQSNERHAKFLSLAAGALGAERSREVVAAVGRLDEMKDVRELTGMLAPATFDPVPFS
jgi:2-methylcitrate dehydratase PrpD